MLVGEISGSHGGERTSNPMRGYCFKTDIIDFYEVCNFYIRVTIYRHPIDYIGCYSELIDLHF